MSKLIEAEGLTAEERAMGEMVNHILDRTAQELDYTQHSVEWVQRDKLTLQWYLFKVQERSIHDLLDLINPNAKPSGGVQEFYQVIQTVDHAFGRFALQVEREPARK